MGPLRGGRAHHDSQLAGTLTIVLRLLPEAGVPHGVPRPRRVRSDPYAEDGRHGGRVSLRVSAQVSVRAANTSESEGFRNTDIGT